MKQKGFLSIILILILLVLAAGSFYFFKKTLRVDRIPEFSANQDLRKTDPIHRSQVFYSANQGYSMDVEYDEDENQNVKCSKKVLNKDNQEFASSETSEFLRDITCLNGQLLEVEGFRNFSGDNMIFNLLGGEISIFNITTGRVNKIAYVHAATHQDYDFMAADTDLKYLLFSKDGYPYIDQVRDFEGKEIFNIQPLLQLADNPIIQSFYDPANHGILYLLNTDKKGYQFNYFDLKTKKMRNLKFIPQRLDTVGRGCSGNTLYPETGRLFFAGGCMDVADKDKNAAGEIILNL